MCNFPFSFFDGRPNSRDFGSIFIVVVIVECVTPRYFLTQFPTLPFCRVFLNTIHFFLFFPPTKVPRFLYYNRQTESCMSMYLCIYLYTCLHIYISLCIWFLLLLFFYYIDIYTFWYIWMCVCGKVGAGGNVVGSFILYYVICCITFLSVCCIV